MATTTHSIKNNLLTWDGLAFAGGLAAGTSMVEASTAASTLATPYANGSLAVSEETDRSGTLAVTIVAGSQLHADLLEREQSSTRIFKNATRRNLDTGVTETYKNMHIANRGDESVGVAESTLVWTFRFEAKTSQVPAQPLGNVVGS